MLFQTPLANYLWVALLAISPISEARGAIIWGLAAELNHFNVFVLSITANILAIPLLYLIFDKTNLMALIDKLLGHKIKRKIERSKRRLEAYEELALLAFVTIPVPGSGVYTATIISEVLKLNRKKSFLVIALGATLAASIIYLTTNGVLSLMKWF